MRSRGVSSRAAWTGPRTGFLAGASAQEAYAKAREAAERALALSPELAAAHVAQGFLLQSADFDWHGAEVELRRALALAPNNSEAKFRLGNQLAAFGELEPALELTRQALVTDPLRALWYNWLARYLLGLNALMRPSRRSEGPSSCSPLQEIYQLTLTIIEVLRGDAKGALAAAQQEQAGSWQDAAIALARQIGSDRSAADAALRQADRGG